MRTKLLPLLLLAAVAGCEGRRMTAANPDNLGKEIAEALAKVAGEEPHPGYQLIPIRTRAPLNLSETFIVADSWNFIGDPDLAETVAKYVKGVFPGTLMECPGRSCYPLSPGDLPSDGMLRFWRTPVDPPNTVTVVHIDFVSVEDEAIHVMRTRGREDLTEELREHYPNGGWVGEKTVYSTVYSVDVERLESGGWKVGKARYACLHMTRARQSRARDRRPFPADTDCRFSAVKSG